MRREVKGFQYLWLLCVVLLFLPVAGRANLRAGAGKADLTPDVKAMQVPLGGYAARRGAPATGVHDHIYARALVLEEKGKKVAIVSVDLCFVPASIRIETAKEIEKAGVKGLGAENLFLSATHTHTASDPLAMHAANNFRNLKGWTLFDARLLQFTAEHIAKAIVEAEKSLHPALAGSNVLDDLELNRNRRGDKILDRAMTLLKVTDLQGKPFAAIVNFAAHPTLYDEKMMEISADWPGILTARLEEKMGNGSVCLFLNGAEGDASPNKAEGTTAEGKVQNYGGKVATVASEGLMAITPKAESALSHWTQQVVLPPRKPNGMFLLAAAQLGASIPQAKELVRALMPEKTEIAFVKIGSLLLIGFPCEPSGAIGLEAKRLAKAAGFLSPAVVALTNDWLAYGISAEQYRAGNYEASMSFYGETFGPTLLEGVKEGLKASH